MKVSELEGAQLALWVAHAEGLQAEIRADGRCWVSYPAGTHEDHPHPWSQTFDPHEDWSQGGPIIEREGISLLQIGAGNSEAKWSANFETWYEEREDPWTGPTPLVAAMRAFVASKCGETLPDEK